jgi:raffinose/stachyose/melibiose transport system substrate-binding protein
VTNTCIFYNKAIFDAAGITEFPTTWDQLISVQQDLKAKGYTPIVLGNKEKWTPIGHHEHAGQPGYRQ